jgi:catechol 2,3-dioxygenase-like lactoylglutathione lyase family enzyme
MDVSTASKLTKETHRISGVSKVVIGVQDQDRAKAFWTETMGFELVQDAPYEQERWLEVRSPDHAIDLVLELRTGESDGRDVPETLPTSNVMFHCDDLSATSEELAARCRVPPAAGADAVRIVVDVQRLGRQPLRPGENGAQPAVTVAWAETVLRDQEMPPDDLLVVPTSTDRDLARRHLELHLERLEERLTTQRREVEAVERILSEANESEPPGSAAGRTTLDVETGRSDLRMRGADQAPVRRRTGCREEEDP